MTTTSFYFVSCEYYDEEKNDYVPMNGFMVAESYSAVVDYVTNHYVDSVRNIFIEEVVWDCGPFVALPDWFSVGNFKKAVKEANEF